MLFCSFIVSWFVCLKFNYSLPHTIFTGCFVYFCVSNTDIYGTHVKSPPATLTSVLFLFPFSWAVMHFCKCQGLKFLHATSDRRHLTQLFELHSRKEYESKKFNSLPYSHKTNPQLSLIMSYQLHLDTSNEIQTWAIFQGGSVFGIWTKRAHKTSILNNVSFVLHKHTKYNINIFCICSVSQVDTWVPSE